MIGPLVNYNVLHKECAFWLIWDKCQYDHELSVVCCPVASSVEGISLVVETSYFEHICVHVPLVNADKILGPYEQYFSNAAIFEVDITMTSLCCV